MSTWITWEEVCRAMAVLCLLAAMAAIAAAVILLVRENLADRFWKECRSKSGRRVGLLAILAVGIWILVIGQSVLAAETAADEAGGFPAAEGAEKAAAAETAAEAATTEETAETSPEAAATAEISSEAAATAETAATAGEAIEERGVEISGTGTTEESEDAHKPVDQLAPNLRIQMTEEVREDSEGNVYCRADNAGIRVIVEENRETDSGIHSYVITVTDCEGNEIRREWENAGEAGRSEDSGQAEKPANSGRMEEEMNAEEIASLSDGRITVNVEAEDEAGNRGQTSFGYILDTREPELTQILTFRQNGEEEGRADGGILYDETDLYYLDERLVTRFRIEDANPVTWQVSYMESPGLDTENSQNSVGRHISGEDPEGNITLLDEGVYSDWRILGEDIAGNKLKPAAECECTQDSEELYEEAGEICLPRRKILDRTAPVGEIVYRSAADGYLYEEESGKEIYWGADVETSLRVRDRCGEQEMPVDEEAYNLLMWTEELTGPAPGDAAGQTDGQAAGQRVTDTAAERIEEGTICMSSDGQVRFGAYGRDRAGNPLTVKEVFDSPVYAGKSPEESREVEEASVSVGKTIPEQGEQGSCSPGTWIVRDTVCPALSAAISRPVGNPDAVDRNHSLLYYGISDSQYSDGIPAVRVTFSVEDLHLDSGRLTPLEAYAPVAEGAKCEEITPGQVIEATATVSTGETGTLEIFLTRYPGKEETPDGVYRFGITGTDKAGNPLKLTEGEDELFGLICSDAASGTFLTGRKVIDTVAPSGSLEVVNSSGTAYLKMEEHAKAWTTQRDGFMPYRREKAATVRFRAKDTSPVSVSCRIRSTSGENNDAAPDGTVPRSDGEEQIGINGEQVFRLESVVFRDRAGNVSAVLERTINLYLDTRLPRADIDAPSATVRAIASITDRSANGQPLYADRVTLEISAEDPDRKWGGSGLREVYCDIEAGSHEVSRQIRLFRGEEPSPDPEEEKEPTYTYSGRITIPSGGQWERNDIVVRVTAVDNAGNRSDSRTGGTYRFGIDTTGPEVTVSYDNNEVRNGQYFAGERTAKITVRERNFDPDKFAVNAPGALTGAWDFQRGGDADEWSLEVNFPADGAYTLDVSGTDALGNSASVHYTGEAPRAFVVDGTPPRMEVFWDNTDVRNGKYYNRERLATVRITELSFDEDRVKILPFSRGFCKVGELPQGAGIYEMELPFEEEGEWALSCTCTDLAGNTAAPISEPAFILDWTAPRLYFDRETVQEMGAYGEFISPVLYWEDENRSPAACCAKWSNLTAGGRTMACRRGNGTSSDESGRAVLPNPLQGRAADGICVLCGTACDLAGNRAFVRRNLCVNRFGSLYDFSEDEATMDMVSSTYTEADRPFVVAEYNVSPLVSRKITLYRDGIGQTLTEGADYTVSQTSSITGWKYVYVIDPSAFSGEGKYSLLLESDDAAGGHNSSPGRFQLGTGESETAAESASKEPTATEKNAEAERNRYAYSPEWAVDHTPPAVRITGVDTGRHRFVTDCVSVRLLPSDNMELRELTIRIRDDSGRLLEEQRLEKEELTAILKKNRGEVPVAIKASGKWQTLTATAVDGAGNCSSGLMGTANEEQGYRLLVSSNVFVHLYRSGILPAAAFLALIAAVWWNWKERPPI